MKTETTYVTCDLCGSIDASEIRFGVVGQDYGIDLCETHMDEFKTILGLYANAAHKIKAKPHSIRRDKPKAVPTPIEKAVENNRRKARRKQSAEATEEVASNG